MIIVGMAVVLNSGVIDFAYKGPFGNVCHFWQSPLRGAAPGMQLVEARDVANVLRCTAPTTKHYPAQMSGVPRSSSSVIG